MTDVPTRGGGARNPTMDMKGKECLGVWEDITEQGKLKLNILILWCNGTKIDDDGLNVCDASTNR